jgi:PIN domain nuclease of toxin-antitoxin system
MSAVVADTHAAIWLLMDEERLSKAAREAFAAAFVAEAPVYVSAVSLVELVYLIERKRLPEEVWQRVYNALVDPRTALEIVPIDAALAQSIHGIPVTQVPEMPDRIIAATALMLDLPLVTRDRRITASPVRTVW